MKIFSRKKVEKVMETATEVDAEKPEGKAKAMTYVTHKSFSSKGEYFLALIFLIVVLFVISKAAVAQDAVDAAQDVDIADVDAKANANSNKVTGVEARLTLVEGNLATVEGMPALNGAWIDLNNQADSLDAKTADLLITDGTLEDRIGTLEGELDVETAALGNAILQHNQDIESLNTQIGDLDQKVFALQGTAPNQGQLDSLDTRVSSLEGGGGAGTNPTLMWVVRDSNGDVVGEWAQRSSVGEGVFNDFRFEVTETTWRWLHNPGNPVLFKNNICEGGGTAMFRSIDIGGLPEPMPPIPFDGSVESVEFGGDLYVLDRVNWTLLTKGTNTTGKRAVTDEGVLLPCVKNATVFNSEVIATYKLAGVNPNFLPPFTLAQE